MIKLGDIVTVRDRVWSVCYSSKMDVGPIKKRGINGELYTFEVIGIECKLRVSLGGSWSANTLIKNTMTGAIWGINACNLQAYRPIMVVFICRGTDESHTLSVEKKKEVLLELLKEYE